MSACGSEVRVVSRDGERSDVDQGCYSGCVAKGVPEADCEIYCSDLVDDSDKKGTGASGKTGTGGSGKTGTGAGANAGGAGSDELDPELEKSCVKCWYDESASTGACGAEAKACESSVACTQLQWCPTLCGKLGCWQECNDVIPSGVDPLAALVQCMACGQGPCAEVCQGSVMLSYCD